MCMLFCGVYAARHEHWQNTCWAMWPWPICFICSPLSQCEIGCCLNQRYCQWPLFSCRSLTLCPVIWLHRWRYVPFVLQWTFKTFLYQTFCTSVTVLSFYAIGIERFNSASRLNKPYTQVPSCILGRLLVIWLSSTLLALPDALLVGRFQHNIYYWLN